MAILCMAYFVAVGALLGAAGALAERALPARAPRRWLWLGVIGLSIALPVLTAFLRSSSEIAILGHHLVRVPSPRDAADAWYAGLGRAWLDCDSPTSLLFVHLSWTAAAVLVLWAAAHGWRLSRLIRRAADGERRGRRIDDVPVIVTDSIGPAAVGLWRSRVVLPRWVLALPETRRRYVIRHEEEHRRAHDARLLALAGALVCLAPWNFALWWQLRRLRLAVELDCDHRVVAALGDAPGYGELLLRVADASSRMPRLQPALAGRAGMLERRLIALVSPAPRGAPQRWLAITAALALVAVVLSVPHPLPEPTTAPAAGASAGAAALPLHAGH